MNTRQGIFLHCTPIQTGCLGKGPFEARAISRIPNEMAQRSDSAERTSCIANNSRDSCAFQQGSGCPHVLFWAKPFIRLGFDKRFCNENELMLLSQCLVAYCYANPELCDLLWMCTLFPSELQPLLAGYDASVSSLRLLHIGM